LAGKRAAGAPQVVGADEGAGKNGDGFSAVQAMHLELPREAGKRTLALLGLYIFWERRDKEFVGDESQRIRQEH
jgi:hypothetical protein